MSTMLRNANDVAESLFGIGRKGCFGLVVLDTFPEVEAK
jgi:hypothetical protein